MQTKLTRVHFQLGNWFWTSIAACVKTPALPPNLTIQWFEIGWTGTTHQ